MKFYREICEKLRQGRPFKFSRWGDGEWGCMFGWEGQNRDGNKYTRELRKELFRILESEPDYYFGLQYGVTVDVGRGYVPELRAFVFTQLFKYDLNLVPGDVLHYASEFGHLKDFVQALKGRDVYVVGADYFKALPYKHIPTLASNSFPENEIILNKIRASCIGRNPVFLVANAMNSNILIDRIPGRATAIDIGSVFDPYLGKPRASYQHTMKISKLW